jgi:hypothetical protein
MTLDDVDHYTAEQKAAIASSYQAHEREARTKGVPTLGSGRIFTCCRRDACMAAPHHAYTGPPFHLTDTFPRLGNRRFLP